MKQIIFVLSLLIFVSVASAKNLLKYETVIDLADHKGSTFLSVMQSDIKPALDEYATEGFKVATGKDVLAALKKVDGKVAARAIRASGGEQELKALADTLSRKPGLISFYDLPEAIADAGNSSGRFDLSTFLALVSGGGVAVKVNADNIAYNVNYGTGENENDERTGRSFGEAPGRLALDASDKHYLTILESYVRSEGANTEHFYKSLLDILLNNDVSRYVKISKAGQAVATDFLAVYTAEQDRHLMVDLKSHHWDEALLEVTLLSAFHAGQKNVMIMFDGELTDTTVKQAPGCDAGENITQKASMVDYWQFSSSTDPANCNRSGINVTRKDFRALGAAITAYQRENNAVLVEKVERHFRQSKESSNLFADLSKFLINKNTPERLDKETLKLAEDFAAFLMAVKKDANKVSSYILERQSR
ncbi:MAG: hypothetical protein AABY53_09270 [Bdellovibrionota bacterium]